MGERIAVAADTNSGITAEEAKAWGVTLIPMPFFIDGKVYYEGRTLTQADFYRHLEQNTEISTSQPALGEVIETWEGLLKHYDRVIYIPMSSGLSSSAASARLLAEDFDGKVLVVDNKRISATQRQAVLDALYFVKQGLAAEKIRDILEQTGLDASIFITVDTLKYLQKGGRITPAAAAVGSVLNIKPVLQIQGDKLDAYKKVRGWKSARRVMIEALESELAGRFSGKDVWLGTAYSGDPKEGEAWRQTVQEHFPDYDVYCGVLPLSISCHTGPGALGIGCMVRLY